MRVVLLGAAGAGKDDLAKALVTRFPELGQPKGHPTSLLPEGLAFGSLADYRTELTLAGLRALQITSEEGLYTHSVLDNLGHEYVRFSELGNADLLDETETTRHFLLSGILYAMVVDSFKVDILIWVPQERGLITTSFDAAVDDFYPEVLDHFAPTGYITYDPVAEPETALRTVYDAVREASGPEHSSEQSSPEVA